jgi:hypothetical protein
MKNQDDARREIIIDQWIWMKLPMVKNATAGFRVLGF